MLTNEINIETFPTAEDFKKSLYEKNINRALYIVYKKLDQVDLSNLSVMLLKSEFHIQAGTEVQCAYTISNEILKEVMKFLTVKGYRIIEIQDANNNHIGWKIYV